MKREMICICCPMGCRMTVEGEDGQYTVTGNTCPRGKTYAIAEMTAPVRMVTSSVEVKGGLYKTVSVKTKDPIPKGLIFDALKLLDGVVREAPVKEGEVVVADILGTGIPFVATREVDRA
ncbi:MAG: DUF1667 domain-containing protein [Clostridia bacterium]|nr:DUF1667 domain-containing protein [Clostridia bacterium]